MVFGHDIYYDPMCQDTKKKHVRLNKSLSKFLVSRWSRYVTFDELKIFNKPLSSNEIMNEMNKLESLNKIIFWINFSLNIITFLFDIIRI